MIKEKVKPIEKRFLVIGMYSLKILQNHDSLQYSNNIR